MSIALLNRWGKNHGSAASWESISRNHCRWVRLVEDGCVASADRGEEEEREGVWGRGTETKREREVEREKRIEEKNIRNEKDKGPNLNG